MERIRTFKMKLTVEVNRRFMAITGICVLTGGALWAIAYFANSLYQEHKTQEMQASYAACEQKKEQYLSEHRFDSLIKEQQWVMSHPDDPRLKDAPHGKQLQEELNGEYKGEAFDIKEDDVPSNELAAFTGRDKDYSLSGSEYGSIIDQQMVSDGSLPDSGTASASGVDGYYLVLENKALMKALENFSDGKSNAKHVAKSLGYTYSVKPEDARKNVLRAIRFANIFSPYSEILSSYAHTGGDPSLEMVASSPLFCSDK